MLHIIAVVVLLALASHADNAGAGQRVLTDPTGNEVRLFDMPCVHLDVLAKLKPAHHDKFQRAAVRIGSQSLKASWIEDQGGIYLMLESGGNARFDPADFADDLGI